MGTEGATALHDVHTHSYSRAYLALLEEAGGDVRIDRSGAGHPRIVWQGIPTVTLHPGTYDPWARLHDPRQRAVALHVVSTTVPNVYPFAPRLQSRAARLINDDLARWRDQQPDHLRGLASIPVDSDDAIAEVDRALDALALSGFVMGTHLGPSELDDPCFAPIFRRLNERAARVLLHPMLPAAGAQHLRDHDLVSLVGFVADTTEVVARLWFGGFFARYPRIRFILPQAGGSALWLLGRWRFGWPPSAGPAHPLPPNVFYDTLLFSPEAVAFAAQAVGTDHLLFGSDYPHLGNAETVWHDVLGAHLDANATQAIGWRNAAALFAD
ncbi:MAG: amidohydrolase family protein [Thermaerobacter sp.]|nr:amidohydrolase family protein [Thermaerobacter sp.]